MATKPKSLFRADAKEPEPIKRVEEPPKDGAADGALLAKHAKEREALRTAHEGERLAHHSHERDDHRDLNLRHETAQKGAKTREQRTALDHHQEHEKRRLRHKHTHLRHAMADRHDTERHELNMKQAAEMPAGGASAPVPDATAAPAPEPAPVAA